MPVKNIMKLGFFLILFLFFFNGCSRFMEFFAPKKTQAPENVVKSFLELSADVSDLSDRERLVELCAGEMRRIFERMTDENFRLAYLKNQLEIEKIEFLDIRTETTEAVVKYRVSIKNNQGSDPTFETSEREVDLIQSRGAWYLEAIRPVGVDTIAFTRGMVF